jgi:regulator of replication initiation timing
MKSWIFIGLLLAMMSGAVYYYYSTTQATIQQLIQNNTILEENNKTLVTANQTNLDTIDDLQTSYDQIFDNYTRLETEFQIIRSQNNKLRERLGKHELDALAAAKPGLVESVINNASKKVSRCFELLSGRTSTICRSSYCRSKASQTNSTNTRSIEVERL